MKDLDKHYGLVEDELIKLLSDQLSKSKEIIKNLLNPSRKEKLEKILKEIKELKNE